jgi:large subunit ribosomal protein L25
MAKEQKKIELIVQPREVTPRGAKKLRREHILPAIVYGHKVEPIAVAVDQKEMERLYVRAGGSTLIDLKVGEEGATHKVFVHDVQRNPTTHSLTHVDFIAVNLREEMTTTVPLALVGESPAVRLGEGVLIHPLDHLQVRALPMELPPLIEVDISGLEDVDDSIYVSDLKVSENVHILNSPEELIAKIAALRVVEEEEEEAAEEAEEEAAEGAEEGETQAGGGEEEES